MGDYYYVKLPGFDLQYRIRVHRHGALTLDTVFGFQVGRFAVRLMPEDSVVGWYDGKGGKRTNRLWVVDHVQACTGVVNVATHEDAMIVADDISRFSKEDVVGDDWDSIARAMGPDILAWCQEIAHGRSLLGGFRAFLYKQDLHLLAVAQQLGLPYEEVRDRYRRGDEAVRFWRKQIKKERFGRQGGFRSGG